MKKLILVILLIFSFSTQSQYCPNNVINGYVRFDRDPNDTTNYKISGDLLTSITTYNSRGEIIIIFKTEDGNIYFTPAYFCNCEKCINFKGLKKLR